MKTKTLIMVCLLFGIGLTQLSAQITIKKDLNAKGTGTIIFTGTVNNYGNVVYCNDQIVDYLEGTMTLFGVVQFKNGVEQSNNQIYRGDDIHSTMTNSDEVFKFVEKDHIMNVYFVEGDPQPWGTNIFRFNYIGNKGTHYIATAIWDVHSQTVTGVIRDVCPGNNK